LELNLRRAETLPQQGRGHAIVLAAGPARPLIVGAGVLLIASLSACVWHNTPPAAPRTAADALGDAAQTADASFAPQTVVALPGLVAVHIGGGEAGGSTGGGKSGPGGSGVSGGGSGSGAPGSAGGATGTRDTEPLARGPRSNP
jgi:uncharacterized membrane protein YgcG